MKTRTEILKEVREEWAHLVEDQRPLTTPGLANDDELFSMCFEHCMTKRQAQGWLESMIEEAPTMWKPPGKTVADIAEYVTMEIARYRWIGQQPEDIDEGYDEFEWHLKAEERLRRRGGRRLLGGSVAVVANGAAIQALKLVVNAAKDAAVQVDTAAVD